MTKEEIYEAGRGIWKCDWRKHKPDYAIVCVSDHILGIFKIESWHAADFERLGTKPDGRYMFKGTWAERYEEYVGTSLSEYPASRTQTPIFYINC